MSLPNKLLDIESKLVSKLRTNPVLRTSPVHSWYNPLEYALEPHYMFLKKYCCDSKKILFLGQNPGPWGMAQTGVPFGDVESTRNWLNIYGSVGKPANENPKHPVTGFECKRREVSGERFWSLFKELCGTPENFFKNSYVHNYCPLLLMEENGNNVTLEDLKNIYVKNSEYDDFLNSCDKSLSEIIELLKIEIIVAIGHFPENQALKYFKPNDVKVIYLVHPSPRNPRNTNWHHDAKETLKKENLLQYFTGEKVLE